MEEMQHCDEIEHVFLSPDAEILGTYSETYVLNEEHLVGSGWGDFIPTTTS